jgi:hypothetical protein
VPAFDEPLNDYASYFKDQHARNVSEYFEELVRISQVDEQANIKTVGELRQLEGSVSQTGSTRKWWRFARFACLAVAAGLVAVTFTQKPQNYLLLIPAVIAIIILFAKVNPAISQLNSKFADLEKQRDEKAAEAWLQMEPLNQLYTWDIARKLFMQTFPDVTLDPYFSIGRHQDLMATYGLPASLGDDKSVVLTQSGAVRNNPFVVARYHHHWVGSRSYRGSLFISWTEQVRNENGQYVNVNRTQTLNASVVKPFPEYETHNIIMYGHEAAPNLTFSRVPSNLSGLEDGRLTSWRKNHAIKKVVKQARREVKSGNSQFTVMSNEEFEALFNAVDRDHEVEFRLLFTPLAQQEMVKLLNDQSIGFGDDFLFTKDGMVNAVAPRHMYETSLDCDPRLFRSLEMAAARTFFNEFHNAYFKSVYFGLAPLLTVPLYREERSLPLSESAGHDTSFWDHEAMANYVGEDFFKHPDSITRNLLKTRANKQGASTETVSVTAYGYAGFDRVDFIPVRGGDGYIHEVPVPWTEYIGVERESTMLVGVTKSHADEADDALASELHANWNGFVQHHGVSSENTFIRGVLAGALFHN